MLANVIKSTVTQLCTVKEMQTVSVVIETRTEIGIVNMLKCTVRSWK